MAAAARSACGDELLIRFDDFGVALRLGGYLSTKTLRQLSHVQLGALPVSGRVHHLLLSALELPNGVLIRILLVLKRGLRVFGATVV
jgi:hypothetical protein